MISGILLPFIGWYAPTFLVSGILVLVGSVLMFKVDQNTRTGNIYGFEVVLALGAGIAAQTDYTVATTQVPASKAGSVIAFINFAQIGSGTVSLAIGGCMFENRGYINLHDALASYDFTPQDLQNALSGSQSNLINHSSREVHDLAISAIAKTISAGYKLVVAAAALLVIDSLTMKWERLNFK